MQYQAISRDEYGQSSIIGTHNSVDEAMSQIRKEVTSLNFENALTTDNKFMSIEAFSVDFFDDVGEVRRDLVYAGNTMTGGHKAINPSNGDEHDAAKEEARIYIGTNEGKEFYLEDHKKKTVDNMSHELLVGKTYYFIKGI